jgi:hypothetical protein
VYYSRSGAAAVEKGWKMPVAVKQGSLVSVVSHRGDRGFESISLRQGVCLTGAFHGYRRKGPAFAASVSLDETRERDLLAMSWLALVDFL